MKKIAIILEHKQRELLYLSILLKKFELLGYEVKIIPQRILSGIKILKFKPDVIFINGLRSDTNFVRHILIPKRKFNSIIISFYTEQIGRKDGIADTYNNKKILNNIDAHIVWGQGFAKGLLKIGVLKEKIWILGSFSLDLSNFFKTKGVKMRDSLSKLYNLNKNKQWILISDNIIRRGHLANGYDLRRKEFNDAIKAISLKFKHIEIIFRPHQDSLRNDLIHIQKEFSNFNNIKIINNGHIVPWILQIDAMIIFNSTSSIEAWANSVPVFAFQTSESNVNHWHKPFIPIYYKKEYLIRDIQKSLEGEFKLNYEFKNNRKLYNEEWFYKIDGKSFDRVCFLLNFLLKNYSPTKKVLKYNFLEVLKVFYLEFNSFIMKIIKKEYFQYNISTNEIKRELIISDIDRINLHDFLIRKGEYGNYIDTIK